MYKEKYLKYKTKYLELQSQLGGSTLEELQTRHTKAREKADDLTKAAEQLREKAEQLR